MSDSLGFERMLISDRSRMGADPVETAAARLLASREEPGGPAALQWREKSRSPLQNYRDLLALTRLLDAETGTKPLLFVNDRIDLALALGLHVHLTEESLPTRVARSLLSPRQRLGRSVHSIESAQRAQAEGADYVLFGPIFDTPSKRAFGPPQGLDRLKTLCLALDIPVVGVGGITPESSADVLRAGAAAWAAITAAWS